MTTATTTAPTITAEGLITAITQNPLPGWLRLGDNAQQVAEFCAGQLVTQLLSESAREVEAWHATGAPTHRTEPGSADDPARIASPLLPALGAWSGLPHHGRVFGAPGDPQWAALLDMVHARVNVGGVAPDDLKAELQREAAELAVDVAAGGMDLQYLDGTDPRLAEMLTAIREAPDGSARLELSDVRDDRRRRDEDGRVWDHNWQYLRWHSPLDCWAAFGRVHTNVTYPNLRTTTSVVEAVVVTWADGSPAAWRIREVGEALTRCWRERTTRELARQLAGYPSRVDDLPSEYDQLTGAQAARRHLAELALSMGD